MKLTLPSSGSSVNQFHSGQFSPLGGLEWIFWTKNHLNVPRGLPGGLDGLAVYATRHNEKKAIISESAKTRRCVVEHFNCCQGNHYIYGKIRIFFFFYARNAAASRRLEWLSHCVKFKNPTENYSNYSL